MALPTSDPPSDPHTPPPASHADIAQAFRDLARGEQTALALESHLTSLERKLDEFLAQFEEPDKRGVEAAVDGSKESGDPGSKKS